MDVPATTADDEALLLGLLNSTPVIDGAPTDRLADLKMAAPWMEDHGVTVSETELRALTEARAVLQAIVRGDQPPAALQPILSATHLVPTATEHGIDWQLTDTSGAVRAALAWDSLRITSSGRLRPCANTECQLFLLDRSKPNTARWCSMAVCGNRMKARRHHNRTSTGGKA
jgi:predicted RNA-binding Zn ribbon-like protein